MVINILAEWQSGLMQTSFGKRKINLDAEPRVRTEEKYLGSREFESHLSYIGSLTLNEASGHCESGKKMELIPTSIARTCRIHPMTK